jgi:hypothetical protein
LSGAERRRAGGDCPRSNVDYMSRSGAVDNGVAFCADDCSWGLVPEFVEIEDLRLLRRLNATLANKLTGALVYKDARTIGYPRGKFRANVRFQYDDADVLYWSGRLSDEKTMVENFLGHGTLGEKASLNIDVQFNLPIVEFSRNSGGAFLRHVPTSRFILAHRGIVTLGHGRLNKAALFDEIYATRLKADSSSGNHEFLFIGELDSPTLLTDIDTFSTELRRAAKAIKRQTSSDVRRRNTVPRRSSTTPPAGLRRYFDEFTGFRELAGRENTVADCYHGDVVRALRDAFDSSSKKHKNREIDLVVLTKTKVFLFEVKTSVKTQSVYTAIGQLMAHSRVVARYVGNGRRLVRVIVVPGRPIERLCEVLTDELDIRLLTYVRSAQGHITIQGLKGIS